MPMLTSYPILKIISPYKPLSFKSSVKPKHFIKTKTKVKSSSRFISVSALVSPKNYYGRRFNLEQKRLLGLKLFGFGSLYRMWFQSLLGLRTYGLGGLNVHRLSENILEKMFWLEKNLKRFKSDRIRLKKQSGHWKALRLNQGLPSRGQRTKTNARTAKRRNRFIKLIFLNYFKP